MQKKMEEGSKETRQRANAPLSVRSLRAPVGHILPGRPDAQGDSIYQCSPSQDDIEAIKLFGLLKGRLEVFRDRISDLSLHDALLAPHPNQEDRETPVLLHHQTGACGEAKA